ncbi:MAG: hypothetical protein M1400_01515 [Patescibacteria group bacterium]|nr:hypothetical protein [Patescibacteria group bacterium]
MSDRLKSLLMILIFVFLAGGLTLTVLSQIQAYRDQQVYLATQATLPVHRLPASSDRLYMNPVMGLSFRYPAILALSDTSTSVELTHQIPFKNHGTCDMKGDTAVYDSLTDFKASFKIVEGTVAQVVKQLSPYMPKENFAGDTLKLSPGFIDEYEAGNLKGFAIYEGVEGCGHTIYYFPIANNRVLVVEQAMVQQLSGVLSSDLEKQVLAVPGVISREKNYEIFGKILKTVQFN